MFSGLPYYSWVIIRRIFSLKNLPRYMWTFKQQNTLHMIFLKHNSLKWGIFLNPIFIPCFSESRFFRAQVFQGPAYSGSRFFRVQVFKGSGFSGFRFLRVRVQVLEIQPKRLLLHLNNGSFNIYLFYVRSQKNYFFLQKWFFSILNG